ncbi:MAG: ZIP family metal transporter [Burkholderiaceae bacterium]
MTLLAIILATLAAGIGSVWLAAALSFGAFARYTQHMLSMAAGALLATAFMHLLPEAFESQAGAKDLFIALLAGLIFFFLLDKAELWHHGHEHHDPATATPAILPFSPLISHSAVDCAVHAEYQHDHAGHGHMPQPGSWALLTGDSVHCFGDGVLIASAFMADLRLGVVAALAVLAHEIPHHMGDLVVLNQSSSNKRIALIKVSLAGSVTTLGGLLGYWLVNQLQDYLPYFLVIVSSSFIYVALADLIPQLQKRLSFSQTAAQVFWLAVGIGMVTVASTLAHGH